MVEGRHGFTIVSHGEYREVGAEGPTCDFCRITIPTDSKRPRFLGVEPTATAEAATAGVVGLLESDTADSGLLVATSGMSSCMLPGVTGELARDDVSFVEEGYLAREDLTRSVTLLVLLDGSILLVPMSAFLSFVGMEEVVLCAVIAVAAVALLKLKPRIPTINGVEAGVLATGGFRTDPVVSIEGVLSCFEIDVFLGAEGLSPACTTCSRTSREAFGLLTCLTSCGSILLREEGEPNISAT